VIDGVVYTCDAKGRIISKNIIDPAVAIVENNAANDPKITDIS
jgi:outer membrane biosynthesis protein TonB